MSLNSHRNLGLVGNQQSRASQRLSSGFRINSAADDAAGLGISEKMRSQIRGLDQASRNGQDGISLIQTAEGAMSTINEMVTRVRELVVQAANDTNAHDLANEATWSQSDRTRIQSEINQLLDEIDATRNRVEFNTRRLIDGSLGGGGVGRGMNAELRELANLFINESPVSDNIEDIIAGRQDVANLQTFLNDVIAFQTELVNIHTFVGSASANELGGGLRTELTNALNATIAEWTSRVNAGLETDVSNEQQALFLAANLTNHLSDRFSGNGTEYTALHNAISTALTTAAGVAGAALGAEGGLAVGNAGNLIDELLDDTANGGAISNAFIVFMTHANQLERPAAPVNEHSTHVNTAIAAVTANLTTGPTDHATLLTMRTTGVAAVITAVGADINALQDLIATDLDIVNDALLAEPAGGYDWTRLAERFGDFDTLWAAWERTGDTDGTPLWFQIGANSNQGVHLSIEDVGVDALARVGTESGAIEDAIRLAFDREGNQLNLDGLTMEQFARQFTFDNLRSRLDPEDIETSTAFGATGGVLRMSGEEINLFITSIDLALSHVTDQRSNLGAMQNRLEFTIENLDIASENLSAAESRIRDADMAREMMRLTQANVLQQAAISMLAQANQAPQSVLQLLG